MVLMGGHVRDSGTGGAGAGFHLREQWPEARNDGFIAHAQVRQPAKPEVKLPTACRCKAMENTLWKETYLSGTDSPYTAEHGNRLEVDKKDQGLRSR